MKIGILDPRGPFLQKWNKIFVWSCVLAVSIDPLFFYIPVIDDDKKCLGLDQKLLTATIVLCSFTDIFYIIHIIFQFRTGFIAPSSQVFGRGVLVKEALEIARRYLSSHFFIDILAVLPLPQAVVLLVIPLMGGSRSLDTMNLLKLVVLFQYVPRVLRVHPLYKEATITSGIFTKTAWSGAALNLFLYMLAGHSGVVGSTNYPEKFFYCFWWGLQNLSSLGQNLKTSTSVWEICFSVFVCIAGLVLFSLLIGNMQKYLLQSTATRLEEWRVKMRDAEQWMSTRLLPANLRERIRRYEQYKWQKTRGVDEENLIRNLPKDLGRDIKRHLGLHQLKRTHPWAARFQLEGLPHYELLRELYRGSVATGELNRASSRGGLESGEERDMQMSMSQGQAGASSGSRMRRSQESDNRDAETAKKAEFFERMGKYFEVRTEQQRGAAEGQQSDADPYGIPAAMFLLNQYEGCIPDETYFKANHMFMISPDMRQSWLCTDEDYRVGWLMRLPLQ